jgi:hypothetical protein
MKGLTNVISIVIIAGMVIAMIGAAYVWAVPMIEKRMTVNDYTTIENFFIELNQRIVDIANSGSGQATVPIPKGIISVRGYSLSGINNNSITLDFTVSQPIMAEGSVPIKTTSLDEIGEYGKTEPRTIILARKSSTRYTDLNMTMRYRELRSSTPKGYIIALCPTTGCGTSMTGAKEVTVSFDKTVVDPRDPFSGGDLTVTYITVNAR